MNYLKNKLKNCNFCKSSLNENVYVPINSKINSKLIVCTKCGLLWLDYDKKKIEPNKLNNFKSLSCDADYSPVRVGKSQMLKNFVSIFKLKNTKFKFILDMSSARGDFVKWTIHNLIFNKIFALEKDMYMTNNYVKSNKLTLIHDQYQNLKFKKKFDLIYSCHSLEHYSDPEKKLVWIHENLEVNKYLYLEVPDPEIINQTENIDEYFYDLHKFYFFENLLKNKLIEIGFKILKQKKINGSVCIFAKKSKPRPGYYLKNSKNRYCYFSVKKKVKNYEINIKRNRKKIIQNFNFTNNTQIIFGAGRILDFLVRDKQIRSLLKSKRVLFIDNFLSKITKNIYGKKLYDESILYNKKNYDVIILSKSSTNEIIEIVKKIKRYKNIYSLFDYL